MICFHAGMIIHRMISRLFFSFLSYITNLLEVFGLVFIRIVPYIGYEWLSLILFFLSFFCLIRRFNVISARHLAICAVSILLMQYWEKFLVTNVVRWVILVW